MKKARRAVAKAPARRKTRTPARRLVLKTPAQDNLSPEEVGHLESLAKRFEESEKAWQRMTASTEDDGWSHVEEHMLQKSSHDSERTWKYFSK